MYKDDSSVILLKNDYNAGFAKGNNLGYTYLKKKFNCDFIVVMNNDMEIVQKDFITNIYNIYDETKFFVLGPDIYSVRDLRHQNPENISNYSNQQLLKFKRILKFKKMFSFGFFLSYLIKRKKRNKVDIAKKDSDYLIKKNGCVLHGSCYIFSFDFITLEDECFYNKTFMYFESYILNYLCTKKNYSILYDPRIQVLHYEDATTDKVYNKSYKKAKFVNKCLLESCKIFIKLRKEYGDL